MEQLGDKPNSHSTSNDKKASLLLKKKVMVAKTHCGHMFHPDCFKAWMKVKQECPFDRTPLPPLNNDDID